MSYSYLSTVLHEFYKKEAVDLTKVWYVDI